MTKELKVFNNQEFGAVRVAEINNEPWFVAKDISDVLEYRTSSDMTRILDEDEKMHLSREEVLTRIKCVTEINNKGMNFINESGLYSAILRSNKPEAKKFKKWVTKEVLPTIRKTGGYLGNTEEMTEEEIMAKALIVAQKTIENKNKLIEELKPKAIFADAVSASHTSILVGELAKILKQNGVDTGQKRFFEWLRDNGYLIKRKGSDYNMPTQKSMDQGLFEIKETTISHSDGHISISKTPKITGKGQVYFINKLKPALALAEA